MSDNQLPEIIELNPKVIVEEIEQKIKSNEVTGFVFAAFNSDGEIVTAKYGVDLIEQQHLVSALQVVVTSDIIRYSNEDN